MTLGDETIFDDGWRIRDLRALRRDRIGFVFQDPYLLPFLDVTDNMALLPMRAGVPNPSPQTRGGVARSTPARTCTNVLERLPPQPASRIAELLPHRWQAP